MDNQITGKGIIKDRSYTQSKYYLEKNIWTLLVVENDGSFNTLHILHKRDANITKKWKEILSIGSVISYVGYIRGNQIYAVTVDVQKEKKQKHFDFEASQNEIAS